MMHNRDESAQNNQELKAMIEAKLQPFVPHVVDFFGVAGLAICAERWHLTLKPGMQKYYCGSLTNECRG